MAVVNILMLVVSSCFVFLLQQPWWATAIGSVCGSAGNYTANGTYQSNLVSMSRTLPGNTSSSPQLFATATSGQAVTLGFKNKTECITICMPGLSSIHIVTS